MSCERRIDPRARVLYLGLVAVGVFFLRRPWEVAALCGVQAALWLGVGLEAKRLVRQVLKLWGFAAFVLASYALTSEDPAIDRWVHVRLGSAAIPLNVAGAVVGLTMVLRVLAVVLASQVARAGDGRAIAAGLGKLGVPLVVATSMDAVLALLGGGGGGRGGGGGGGGGRRRRERQNDGTTERRNDGMGEGFWASLKRLARGDVGPIASRIERHIERVEDHLAESAPEGDEEGARKRRAIAKDVAIIAGISLTMLGIKALKVLPSIPFAPGHKLVLLTPLYIVASMKTRSRMGATLTGITMGSVAFLLGDGRYGIFEILKHVTPGVLCDLLVPLVAGHGERRPGRLAWTILGAVIGSGRFATIFVVTLTVQAPAVAYAILVPGLLVHTIFGALSGFVSGQLVRAIFKQSEMDDRLPAGSAPAAVAAPAEETTNLPGNME